MSDRELDVQVATEVMGWIWITSELNEEQKILVPTDESISIPDSSWWWGRDVKALVPHYSRDIAAAWLVEERIEELGLVEKYCNHLASIVWSYQAHPAPLPLKWYSIHASPEDRCRAALMAAEAE